MNELQCAPCKLQYIRTCSRCRSEYCRVDNEGSTETTVSVGSMSPLSLSLLNLPMPRVLGDSGSWLMMWRIWQCDWCLTGRRTREIY